MDGSLGESLRLGGEVDFLVVSNGGGLSKRKVLERKEGRVVYLAETRAVEGASPYEVVAPNYSEGCSGC